MYTQVLDGDIEPGSALQALSVVAAYADQICHTLSQPNPDIPCAMRACKHMQQMSTSIYHSSAELCQHPPVHIPVNNTVH